VEYFPPEVTAADANVVVDGKVVTSRGPATSTEFALTLVEQLYGKEKAEEIAKTMVRVLALLLPLMCSCPAARRLAVHF
jgi:4-methyl-5(b-hydroxyethyl)-thiazole monophosphate biosynthesis